MPLEDIPPREAQKSRVRPGRGQGEAQLRVGAVRPHVFPRMPGNGEPQKTLVRRHKHLPRSVLAEH